MRLMRIKYFNTFGNFVETFKFLSHDGFWIVTKSFTKNYIGTTINQQYYNNFTRVSKNFYGFVQFYYL